MVIKLYVAESWMQRHGQECQANLVLSPFSIGSICICVSSTVVQPGQISEGVRIQLRLRNAQLMTQLPHCCTLHTHGLVMLLCSSGCHAVVKFPFYRGTAFIGWHGQEEGCGAKDIRRIYDEDTAVNSSGYVYTVPSCCNRESRLWGT